MTLYMDTAIHLAIVMYVVCIIALAYVVLAFILIEASTTIRHMHKTSKFYLKVIVSLMISVTITTFFVVSLILLLSGI